MHTKGFTLLQVLIAVIIIGVLAAISFPQFLSTIERANAGKAAANIGGIRISLDRYWYRNGSMPPDLVAFLDAMEIENPNNATNKLYTYSIENNESTPSERKYAITATRVGDATYYVKWIQIGNSGKFYKSSNLGGPEPPG